ncbi:ribonuclease H-like domain-containing protein [Tanacetum coccineum]
MLRPLGSEEGPSTGPSIGPLRGLLRGLRGEGRGSFRGRSGGFSKLNRGAIGHRWEIMRYSSAVDDVFTVQNYATHIKDGNSFKPIARTTTNADGTSTSTIPGAITADEKSQKKNDLKARSILMMTLSSEHLLTFNKYKDAKTLFEVIEARFGGNEATKKTQKILLKQVYENFNASSSESLDSIFTWLQKIVSQLAILGENISQEDLNFKFLRSLPSEWSMHIIEQEVKRSVTSRSNSNSQNVAFVSTPSSTNGVNTSNVHVSTASSSLSTASTTDNSARLSDATIYAFLANQPNGSQVVHEDLEQIHKNDLEEMDLKWQLALLSMKARKFHQRTGKKIIINGSDNAGYDKTKVECFNCHKMGHFARECRNPRSQENRSRNQDSSRKTVNVEESSSKAMLAIDGVGFDWSFMTEEKNPSNFALMAFSYSEVQNNKTCSKTCLKRFKDLKSQYDNLRIELNKSEFDLANYKRGLASVEEQLVFYKKNEGMLCDQIDVLKRDASFNESEINALKIQIERLKKEKKSNQIKIDNFENASKSLDKLIGSQISDNNINGVGYNAVAPPPTGLFAPPTIDLSNSGLEEFKQPEFEGYEVKVKKNVSENSSNEIKKTSGAPIIQDWVSDCDEDETLEKVSESANAQKPKQADQPRKVSQNPRNYSTNWNTPISKKLGMVQKPVLNNEKKGTVQREVRPVWNNAMRTNHQNFSNSRRNFAPTTVLTKSGLVPISAARQNSSRTTTTVSAARPIKTVAPKPFVNVAKSRPNAFQKSHLPSRRPFYQQTTLKNRNNKVNTVKANFVNTAKEKKVTSAVGEQGIDAVKSKACWVWRPKLKVLDHDSKNSGSYICKQFDYVDPTGRIKHQELASPEQTVSGKDFSNPLIVDRVHVPLFDTMLLHDQPGQGEGPTVSVESQHTPTASSPSKSQPTTSQPRSSQETSSQAPSSHEPTNEQQILQTTSSMPYDSPLPGGSTPGSVEGSMQLKELTNLCTKLLARVTNLETELKKTKALTKLVKKVKTFGRSAQVYNKEEKCKEEVEYGDILEQIIKQVTLSKGPQGEEQSQESSEVHFDVLSTTKIFKRCFLRKDFQKLHQKKKY